MADQYLSFSHLNGKITHRLSYCNLFNRLPTGEQITFRITTGKVDNIFKRIYMVLRNRMYFKYDICFRGNADRQLGLQYISKFDRLNIPLENAKLKDVELGIRETLHIDKRMIPVFLLVTFILGEPISGVASYHKNIGLSPVERKYEFFHPKELS